MGKIMRKIMRKTKHTPDLTVILKLEIPGESLATRERRLMSRITPCRTQKTRARLKKTQISSPTKNK